MAYSGAVITVRQSPVEIPLHGRPATNPRRIAGFDLADDIDIDPLEDGTQVRPS
jgi:hypothetical protein